MKWFPEPSEQSCMAAGIRSCSRPKIRISNFARRSSAAANIALSSSVANRFTDTGYPREPLGIFFFIKSSSLRKFGASLPIGQAKTPQAISPPTKLGTSRTSASSSNFCVKPTRQSLPGCPSGIMATFEPSAAFAFKSPYNCVTASVPRLSIVINAPAYSPFIVYISIRPFLILY